MKKIPKFTYFLVAVVMIFGALTLGNIDNVWAEEIANGVYVFTLPANPSCATLNAMDGLDYAGITSDFGFKLDGIPPSGSFTYPLQTVGEDLMLTGGAPEDLINSISVEGLTDYSFNWLASLGIDAVIVKASNSAETYVYLPEAMDGGPLFSVEQYDKDGNWIGYYAISHIEFCYDYELTAEKTANAEYTRTYSWEITKEANAAYEGFIGDAAFDHYYTVSVDRSEVDSDYAVRGEIVVDNPTPYTVPFSVSDLVDGIPTTVDCPADTLLPGGSVTCTYTAALAGKVDGTNTATITSGNPAVGGATATAGYTFGAPTNVEGYETVNVADEFYGTLGAASGDTTFASYSKSFQCPADPAVYTNGVYTMTQFVNTATIDETGQSDDAKVDLTCYAPVVSKDADASYDERHEWSVTKTVDPEAQSAFIGDTVNFNWTITVDEEVYEENHAISGTIYVQNPSTMPMTVSIADVLDDGTPVMLGCEGSLTIPAGQTGECAYSAAPDDDSATLNTATATLNGIGFDATAAVNFEKNVIRGSATLDDDQMPYSGVSVYDGWTATYADSYTCSTSLGDYTGGADLDNLVSNTAEVYSDDALQDSATATTEIDCYIPSISKTAAGTYDEKHTWEVDKTVTPTPQYAFAGETVDYNWTVEVSETVSDEKFDVTGTITVNNPNPEDELVVSLVDWVNGNQAVIDQTSCDFDGTYLTVAAGGSETCNYAANDLGYEDVDLAPDLNTATATYKTFEFEAVVPIGWTANIINPEVTLDDDLYDGFPLTVNEGGTYNYAGSYTCSKDSADYEGDGTYQYTQYNLATVKAGETLLDSDDATEVINCYAPQVTKTAAASYDETHTWDIEKSATPPVSGYPGDELSWTWTVTLSESSVDSNFKVSGEITITNPAPMDMTVSIADQMDDGTIATVDCGEGVDVTAVVVPAYGIRTCTYEAVPAGKTATLNKAIVVLNKIPFTGTADVNFVANVINGSAVVDDDQESDFPTTVYAGEGPWIWTETGTHPCSELASAYGSDGTYGETLYNTATVTGSDGQTDSASAETAYLCKAGFVDLLKLTDGLVNPAMTWNFALYYGPDGFGSEPIGTGTTLGDADGVLDFGAPALRPDKTYTVCELEVAAGYTSHWQVDVNGDGTNDATVIPYNPNADNDPPEDLGNRCVDFGAGTTIPVTVGTTTRFEVDNQAGGGDPRTPGYWKNWNRCTGGGQQFTADANGGWEEGFWLLEDVLDPSIGGGIIWDDILTDTFEFPIEACEDAVLILDKRDLDGKKVASDPLHNLATHLLAAQLNFGAGACTTQEVLDAALAAEALLDQYNFDGYGHDKLDKKSDDGSLANSLANYLDFYNNGEFCGSTYVP